MEDKQKFENYPIGADKVPECAINPQAIGPSTEIPDSTTYAPPSITAKAFISWNSSLLMNYYRLTKFKKEPTEEEKSEYRYVIYARHSLDEPNPLVNANDKKKQNAIKNKLKTLSPAEKQRYLDNSITAQIDACKVYAENQNLRVDPTPIFENCSAKTSGEREKFDKLIELLKKNVYDGILCWHPDRLSRNMLEAGMIIDLLDKNIIKDLKFVTFPFTNDPNGKMTLGILFVISKVYSDNLSKNVIRGQNHKTQKGEAFVDKHGYIIEDQKYKKSKYFDLIQQAWNDRISGKFTQEEIAENINKGGYEKYDSDLGVYLPFKFTNKNISTLFQESFYTGVYKYGESMVDLNKLYAFDKMVSIDDFCILNRFNYDNYNNKRYVVKNNKKAKFLNGMVLCANCNHKRHVGLSTNKKDSKVSYLLYRCPNPKCISHNKSTNGKVLLDFVEKLFTNMKVKEKNVFEQIKQDAEKAMKESKTQLIQQRNALKSKIESNEVEIVIKQRQLNKKLSAGAIEMINNAINGNHDSISEIKKQILVIDETLEELKRTDSIGKEFLELVAKLPSLFTSNANTRQKELIIKSIFSNFEVDGTEVKSYKLKAPFDVLIEIDDSKMFLVNRSGGA